MTRREVDATKISDAGLAHLRGMKRLGILGVSKTKVTDKGVKTLQKALPKLKINY